MENSFNSHRWFHFVNFSTITQLTVTMIQKRCQSNKNKKTKIKKPVQLLLTDLTWVKITWKLESMLMTRLSVNLSLGNARNSWIWMKSKRSLFWTNLKKLKNSCKKNSTGKTQVFFLSHIWCKDAKWSKPNTKREESYSKEPLLSLNLCKSQSYFLSIWYHRVTNNGKAKTSFINASKWNENKKRRKNKKNCSNQINKVLLNSQLSKQKNMTTFYC